MKIGPCPACKGTNLETRRETHPLLYGVEPAQVELTVTEPVIYCLDCQEAWTDWRGENARGIAASRLLNSAPALAAALLRTLKVIDALMPGIGGLALQDHKIINDVPLEAHAALKKAGVKCSP